MKTKIFIDFDGTLFDTKKFKEAIFSIFKKNGFSDEELLTEYQKECLDYKFSLKHFILRLSKIKKFNEALINARISELFRQAPKFLFDDTINFLGKIDRETFSPILLTLGDRDFQQKKVEHSTLGKYFDDIQFTEKQKWDYLKDIVSLTEKFVIIDDRSDAIAKIKQQFPNCLALEIDRKDEDKDDPMRNVSASGNLVIKNFRQARMYLN